MKLLKKLWLWIVSLFSRKPRPLGTVRVEELPDRLDPRAVYLVGEGEHQWFVALICPCGCGETLHMSLLPDARPRWRARVNESGTVSLEPSVWRQVGCKSHFFLRHGFIQWCPKESFR